MRRVFNNVIVQSAGNSGHVLPPVVPFPTKEELASLKEKTKPGTNPLDDLLDGDVGRKPKPVSVDPKAGDDPDLKKLQPGLDQKNEDRLPLPVDFQADGNLHWSYDSDLAAETLCGRFRGSANFETSPRLYPPGWTTHDLVSDPRFVLFNSAPQSPVDLRPKKDSPARDSGVPLSKDWPGPLREDDAGKPDIGAIPVAAEPARIGLDGRLDLFGRVVSNRSPAAPEEFLVPEEQLPKAGPVGGKPAVIVPGYPASDAPLL